MSNWGALRAGRRWWDIGLLSQSFPSYSDTWKTDTSPHTPTPHLGLCSFFVIISHCHAQTEACEYTTQKKWHTPRGCCRIRSLKRQLLWQPSAETGFSIFLTLFSPPAPQLPYSCHFLWFLSKMIVSSLRWLYAVVSEWGRSRFLTICHQSKAAKSYIIVSNIKLMSCAKHQNGVTF